MFNIEDEKTISVLFFRFDTNGESTGGCVWGTICCDGSVDFYYSRTVGSVGEVVVRSILGTNIMDESRGRIVGIEVIEVIEESSSSI
jgi:hypothetical protein